jgi:hypothetical protein
MTLPFRVAGASRSALWSCNVRAEISARSNQQDKMQIDGRRDRRQRAAEQSATVIIFRCALARWYSRIESFIDAKRRRRDRHRPA